MSQNRFEHLTGTVSVRSPAPADWQDQHTLPFWHDPNNAAWGGPLCRVLYHETIHFWQVLSAGYIANLVNEEWGRLLAYERTGRLPPASALQRAYAVRGPDQPFSAKELVECWARYWDVHTRNPAQVVREEGLEVPARLRLTRHRTGGGTEYSGQVYEFFMEHGPDCAQYAVPYQWLRETLGVRGAAGFVFPIVAHHAFGSPDPVGVFCACAVRLKEDPRLREPARWTGSINEGWFREAPWLHEDIIEPTLREREMPHFTSGLDVMRRGLLRHHPVFGEYPDKATVRGWVRARMAFMDPGALPSLPAQVIAECLNDLGAAEHNPDIPFALPGQPTYRLMLGQLVAPPRIHFANLTWYAPRPILLRQRDSGLDDEPTFAARTAAIDERVARFRAAKKAVALGLPPDAFEGTSEAAPVASTPVAGTASPTPPS